MNKFIAKSLGILIAGSLSVAMAAQPLPPKRAAAAAAPAPLPMLTKAAIRQSMNMTFAYRKPVRASALMTKQEKRWYRAALQAARTLEARRQIRELTYARLVQRATERGMLIVFPNSAAYVAAHPDTAPQLHEAANREPVRVAAIRPVETKAPPAQNARTVASKPTNATPAPQQVHEALRKPVRVAALRPVGTPAHPAAPAHPAHPAALKPLPPRH